MLKYSKFLFNGIRGRNPVQVTLFVTSRCNLRCKMCFYWEPIENSSKGEISLNEIEKISKSMPNFTWLLIGGGEPFIRKDLPDIITHFYNNNDILGSSKMREKHLLFFSMVISYLALLYLLFINIFRKTFILSDWLVIAIDLFVKLFIEFYILFIRRTR